MKRILLLLALLGLTSAAFADSDLVKKASPYSARETMDKFEKIIKDKGMTVFARIDHKANAKTVDMDMSQAEVLIFGNPMAGTRIMKHDPAAGLDLPLRVLAYTDYDGKTWLLYHNPEGLKDLYKVSQCVAIEKVSGALDKLTDAAIK